MSSSEAHFIDTLDGKIFINTLSNDEYVKYQLFITKFKRLAVRLEQLKSNIVVCGFKGISLYVLRSVPNYHEEFQIPCFTSIPTFWLSKYGGYDRPYLNQNETINYVNDIIKEITKICKEACSVEFKHNLYNKIKENVDGFLSNVTKYLVKTCRDNIKMTNQELRDHKTRAIKTNGDNKFIAVKDCTPHNSLYVYLTNEYNNTSVALRVIWNPLLYLSNVIQMHQATVDILKNIVIYNNIKINSKYRRMPTMNEIIANDV